MLMQNLRNFGLEVEKERPRFGEEFSGDLFRMDVCCNLRQPLCHDATPTHASFSNRSHKYNVYECTSIVVKPQNTSPTLSAQSLQRQHDSACDLGILQTTVCLGFELNSENELSLMLDQQPGTDYHKTFVHRPLWTFLNGSWRHIYIQKLLT